MSDLEVGSSKLSHDKIAVFHKSSGEYIVTRNRDNNEAFGKTNVVCFCCKKNKRTNPLLRPFARPPFPSSFRPRFIGMFRMPSTSVTSTEAFVTGNRVARREGKEKRSRFFRMSFLISLARLNGFIIGEKEEKKRKNICKFTVGRSVTNMYIYICYRLLHDHSLIGI